MTGNYYVYIMNNQANTVLYTGMTNDVRRRVIEHKSGKGAGFTVKYKTKKFVFYERFDKAVEAISAEKRIKAGSRKKKIELISSMNPEWKDLYNEINGCDCFVPVRRDSQ
jgi:putative endonuclease